MAEANDQSRIREKIAVRFSLKMQETQECEVKSRASSFSAGSISSPINIDDDLPVNPIFERTNAT